MRIQIFGFASAFNHRSLKFVGNKTKQRFEGLLKCGWRREQTLSFGGSFRVHPDQRTMAGKSKVDCLQKVVVRFCVVRVLACYESKKLSCMCFIDLRGDIENRRLSCIVSRIKDCHVFH